MELLTTPVDDLRVRDTVPVVVKIADGIEGPDLNVNGWGGDEQFHTGDGRVAAQYLEAVGAPRRRSALVGGGGSLETDGQVTLLVTESSLVSEIRNPWLGRDQVVEILRDELDMEAVI